jgi:DNA-directed RNA polymerase beta subunit
MFKKFKSLDQDGMAHVAQELHDGDIYINKHVPDPATLPKG